MRNIYFKKCYKYSKNIVLLNFFVICCKNATYFDHLLVVKECLFSLNIKSMNFFKKLVIIPFFFIFLLNSCGGKKIWDPSPASETPHQADERVRRNIEEGKGIKLLRSGENAGGTVMFASANPLWKATMDTLDFMILSSADYGGGIIITDWYSEQSNDEAIKVTVRFLSDEIRSDSLKIFVHKKICNNDNRCKIQKLKNDMPDELRLAILKRAVLIEKDIIKKRRKAFNKKYPRLGERGYNQQ